ncbi:MAG: leucyl aminopeptidase [Magnetococcales bacterium]|nr:leucyl aminopeptidase [Magnetococcales bacterium]
MKDQLIKLDVLSGHPGKWRGDTLAIAVFKDSRPQESLSICDEPLKKAIGHILEGQWISGRLGDTLLIPTPAESGMQAQRILLIGLGSEAKIDHEKVRKLGANLACACQKHNIPTLNCLISLDKLNTLKEQEVIESLAEGIWLGSYTFNQFQTKKSEQNKKNPVKKIGFGIKTEPASRHRQALSKVEKICRGVILARNLGNQPGNLLTPEGLALQAKELSENLPIKTTVFSEKTLARKKMAGILAVGMGSQNKPRLITMEYLNGGKKPLLAVVGKAVTFDSGGISLKPGIKMEEMKFDMCGGAAVFGFMQAIAEMKLPINVVGIVPAAENLPSSTAQRPGDIIKTAKGIFVEVVNTDAEGRLILADALHHAESFAPDTIIDLATLTGACVVALGSHVSAVMGNQETLLKNLQKVGDRCGDLIWPFPMLEEYQNQIKSTVADIKNVGGTGGGTITAGCFLSRFVEENRNWAHLDIAGTAWDLNGTNPVTPKGATGVGVRLLCRYAEEYFA